MINIKYENEKTIMLLHVDELYSYFNNDHTVCGYCN